MQTAVKKLILKYSRDDCSRVSVFPYSFIYAYNENDQLQMGKYLRQETESSIYYIICDISTMSNTESLRRFSI